LLFSFGFGLFGSKVQRIMYIRTALSRKTEGNGPMMSWQPPKMNGKGANSNPPKTGTDKGNS
jgi:hypothetical protein